MRYLTDQAARLNITIYSTDLPGGEKVRYQPDDRRILVQSTLTLAEAEYPIRIALAHAYFGDRGETASEQERATRHVAFELVHAVESISAKSVRPKTGVISVIRDTRRGLADAALRARAIASAGGLALAAVCVSASIASSAPVAVSAFALLPSAIV